MHWAGEEMKYLPDIWEIVVRINYVLWWKDSSPIGTFAVLCSISFCFIKYTHFFITFSFHIIRKGIIEEGIPPLALIIYDNLSLVNCQTQQYEI